MTREQWIGLRERFDRALELPLEARSAFIDEVRSQDPDLGRELDELLACHEANDDRFDHPIMPSQVFTKAFGTARLAAVTAGNLEPGLMVEERYEILQVLGEGGFGTAYAASDVRLDGRKVVLKVMKQVATDWIEKRFREEVRALSRLDHPSIVRVIDSGRLETGQAYLVMQYVPGPSLSSILHDRLQQARAVSLLRQLAEALAAAHAAGILHRDIKPSNVIVRDAGQPGERAVLIDFGIARTDATPAGESQTTVVSGSPQYMAPEQLLGRTSRSSDVYSLGALAFEILTGLNLLESTMGKAVEAAARAQLAAVQPRLAQTTIETVVHAIMPDAQRRLQSAEEFGLGLAPEKGAQKNRWMIPTVLVSALALSVVGLISHQTSGPPQKVQDSVEVRAALSRRSPAGADPARPLKYGESLRAGDELQLVLDASRPGYFYLFDESAPRRSAQAQFTLLFPGAEPAGVPAPVQHQRVPALPSAWLIIDGLASDEWIWVVWSQQPVPELEPLRSYSKAPDRGALPAEASMALKEWLNRNSSAQSTATDLTWKDAARPVVGRVRIPVY